MALWPHRRPKNSGVPKGWGIRSMDFILDYMSEQTYWTILFTIHALLAVALLGALTHQAAHVLRQPKPAGAGFLNRFSAVSGHAYASAVCLLWVLTFIFGAWIYVKYRIYVRIPIEQEGFYKTLGAFEMKEHLGAIGLGLLPLYWIAWKRHGEANLSAMRKGSTLLLAFFCWVTFLVGHIVNNVRGFGS
jgi:hypothetical protein